MKYTSQLVRVFSPKNPKSISGKWNRPRLDTCMQEDVRPIMA